MYCLKQKKAIENLKSKFRFKDYELGTPQIVTKITNVNQINGFYKRASKRKANYCDDTFARSFEFYRKRRVG